MLGIYLFAWNRYVLMVNTLRSEQILSIYWSKVCIGKGGGLTPNGQQVIVLTNGDPAHGRTHAYLDLNELMQEVLLCRHQV